MQRSLSPPYNTSVSTDNGSSKLSLDLLANQEPDTSCSEPVVSTHPTLQRTSKEKEFCSRDSSHKTTTTGKSTDELTRKV